MKKIISYSLWGTDNIYLVGAVENIKLQKTIYPDWICRFYIDDSITEEFENKLKNLGAEVFRKSEDGSDYMGLFWRFEVAFDDPDVERFIVRDCDSRLYLREKDAVREWVESELSFHVMRDHKLHDIFILGGMWGAIPKDIPFFKETYFNFLNNIQASGQERGKYFYKDQDFLNSIWNKVKDFTISHDDFFGEKFTCAKMEKFKISVEGEGVFVGCARDEFDIDLEIK